MTEEPAKLDALPELRRRRTMVVACAVFGVLLVGAAALAFHCFWSTQPRITSPGQLPLWHEIHCEVGPTDWSREVDGLSCKLAVTSSPVGQVNTAVRVRNAGRQPLIVFADGWHIRAEGPAVYQSCKPIGARPPMGEPMIILPGEDCEVPGTGLNSYGYSYQLGLGRAKLFAIYSVKVAIPYGGLDADGLPKNLTPSQIEKLEGARRKSPGLPSPRIWCGDLRTEPVRVTVQLLPKPPPREVSSFTCGQARIAVGMTKDEVHAAIVQKPQMEVPGYGFVDYDASQYRAGSWRFTYGPERLGAGRYDDIRLTFDRDRVTKIVVASSSVP